MSPMKRSVNSLFETYKTREVRKVIVDSVFESISKLHSIGINHGDPHLDNIMVEYKRPASPSKKEMQSYEAFNYVYKFIDFGAAETLNEREKYKQMIGDYAKASDSIGLLAEEDPTLVPIFQYAEEKTRALSIDYGLTRPAEDDSDEEWSDSE